jgi:hypothetical protein
MSRMVFWPSIEQFRSVVKNVQMKTRYRGKDENGEAIFDAFAKLPKLKFEGTVKLHGSNGAVGVSPMQEIWFQSRAKIITPERDNAGFAMFGTANIEVFLDIVSEVVINATIDAVDIANYNVLIFGEWCGGNIQKGVAISQVPKMFVIFGIALLDAEGNKTYLTREQVESVTRNNISHPRCPDTNIFSIYDFPTFGCEIDFENPHEIVEFLNARTAEVEAECPVAKAFGVYGIGEGIVWRCVTPGFEDSGFFFKVKGEEHSKSKVKTLAAVDVDKINNIKELAEKLAHRGRLDQIAQTAFDLLNGGEVDIKRTGDFIQAVMKDVAKEELDVIAASGFNIKEVSGPISKISRDYLLANLHL